jgi:hypothetical protein
MTLLIKTITTVLKVSLNIIIACPIGFVVILEIMSDLTFIIAVNLHEV